jgi:hypothetical protein
MRGNAASVAILRALVTGQNVNAIKMPRHRKMTSSGQRKLADA